MSRLEELDGGMHANETSRLRNLEGACMLFFRGVSRRRMIRVLLPYALGLFAVLAVLAFYLTVTGEVASNAASSVEEKAVQVTWELSRLASDSSTAALMFMSYTQEDMLFRRLKPDFTDLLGLDDYTYVVPLEGAFSSLPFGQDSLAERAVDSGELQLRRNVGAEAGGLTVFFPATVDSGPIRSLSRTELPPSTESISFDRYRYMFFILTAAVIVLIIVPAIILRLADLRRRTDLNRFANPEIAGWKHSAPSRATLRDDPMLSSFFSGNGAPALIRLDRLGSILDMSPSALALLDISSEASSGMLFHKLPGLITGGHELYPDDWRSGSFLVALEDSSGKVRKIRFSAESLGDEGCLLAGHAEESGTGGSELADVSGGEDAGQRAGIPVAADLHAPDSSLEQILRLASEGRESAAPGTQAAALFERICDLATSGGVDFAADSAGQGIEISSELDRIAQALNDVLPERARVEIDSPGFLPEVRFTRQDLTQFIKNMVFYSLESVQGQVRIRLSTREVSSPVTDSVFSARCDRSVGASVSLCYTDGARMPVRLKEALLDPETDSSGIRRDFGTHVTAAAAILSDRDCYPVFTEGTLGTKLHILLPTVDKSDFDAGDRGTIPSSGDSPEMSVVICDASKAVRENVAEALGGMGVNAVSAASVEELLILLEAGAVSRMVLDASVLERDPEQVLQSLREKCPEAGFVVTTRLSQPLALSDESGMDGMAILAKPYSPLELMEALIGLAGSVGTSKPTRTG
jgi:CheY-like chemotaxis protein